LIRAYLVELLRRAKEEPLKVHWITQDALTSVVVTHALEQGKVLLLGPSYFCPVRPRHIHRFQKRLEGELRRTTFQKIAGLFHLTPPFSDISRETVFVHMGGGRASRKAFEKLAFVCAQKKPFETKGTI
jgi:hypothetical protein